MRLQFYKQEVFCVVCTKPVPPERKRYKSITCSEQCKKTRKRSLYVKQSMEECMFCRKPTTPAEQQLYRRFRMWAKENPALAFPAQYNAWKMDQQKLCARNEAFETQFTFERGMEMLEASLLAKELKKQKAEAEFTAEDIQQGVKMLEASTKGRAKNDRTGLPAPAEMGQAEAAGPEVQDPTRLG